MEINTEFSRAVQSSPVTCCWTFLLFPFVLFRLSEARCTSSLSQLKDTWTDLEKRKRKRIRLNRFSPDTVMKRLAQSSTLKVKQKNPSQPLRDSFDSLPAVNQMSTSCLQSLLGPTVSSDAFWVLFCLFVLFACLLAFLWTSSKYH